ncbi:hypothetical protein EYF80_033036 [Liparis tanakae]|uniref:Uncharacterized protein n=1 Tax=Liparis tanakae TaxID=230148 RepID=A0A4Z2GSX6_9TELE|nr:hypothetical protein EYF80_033036 [Liparis tanakae]
MDDRDDRDARACRLHRRRATLVLMPQTLLIATRAETLTVSNNSVDRQSVLKIRLKKKIGDAALIGLTPRRGATVNRGGERPKKKSES